MERFHGFEDDEPAPYGQPSFEDGPPDPRSGREARLPQRHQDIAELLGTRTYLLQRDLGTELPAPSAVWYDRIPKDPFGKRYMELRTLQQLGYGIGFAEDAQIPLPRQERHPDATLSVYVDAADKPAIEQVAELTTAVSRLPDVDRPPLFRDFLDLMQEEGGIYAWQLQSVRPDAPPAVTAFMTPQEEALVPYLRERGFMTSRVLYGMNGFMYFSDPDHYDTREDRQLYNRLSRSGHRPFSAQELYDFGAIPAVYVLSAHKDSIPPPASRQRQPEAGG